MKKIILAAAVAVTALFAASAEIDFDCQAVWQPLNAQNLNVYKVRGSDCDKGDDDEIYREKEYGVKAGISYIWDDSSSTAGSFTFYPGVYGDFTYLKINNARTKACGNQSGLKTSMLEASGNDFYLDLGVKGRFEKGKIIYFDLFFGLSGNIVSFESSEKPSYSAFEFAGGVNIGGEAGIKLAKIGNITPSFVIGARVLCLEGFGDISEDNYKNRKTNFNGTDFNCELTAGIRLMLK